MQSWLLTLLATLVVVTSVGGSRAVEAQSFYEGKTVRIIVGLAPGGGYDTYARVIARHLGKHIPGNPTVIVENMPGAGSLISANHLFKVAKPDGLTVGKFSGTLFLGQVLGQPGIEFDAPEVRVHRRRGQGGRGLRPDQGQRRHERGEVDGVRDARQAGRPRPGSSAEQHGPDPEGGSRASDPPRLRVQGHLGDPAGRRWRRGVRRLLVLGVDARDLAQRARGR